MKAADIQSSQFSFGEHYKRSSTDRIRDGFYATNELTVRVTNLAKVTELVDSAVKAGATEINGPNLTISDPMPLQDAARKSAYQDARAKAFLYAEAAGGKVGRLISLEEERYDDLAGRRQGGGKAGVWYDDDGEDTTGGVGLMEVGIAITAEFEIIQ